jgi:hypothetical protein
MVPVLYILYVQTRMPKVSLYAFRPYTNRVNTLFEEDVESLVRIIFVSLLIPANKSF